MDRRTWLAAAGLAHFLMPIVGQAQVPAVPAAPVSALASGSPGQPCTDCIALPALTPVRITIGRALGSKISKTGDVFPITLTDPIRINGKTLVPAGVTGMGEVVHAKGSGGSGAAGELVLAARYLEWGGRRLRLRSIQLAPSGQSNINKVNALNVASAASPLPIGLLGLFITGGQVTVPEGTIADAKTAEAVILAPVEPAEHTENDKKEES